MHNKADLHIHSTASDGSLSPTEIVKAAISSGIDTIAISDHNTVEGLPEAILAGKENHVTIIPAVELSTRYNDESIHLLGFFRDLSFQSSKFKKVLNLISNHKVNKISADTLKLEVNEKTKYLSTNDGIKLLKQFNAAVVLAHPMRISSKNISSILKLNFDGIEAKYSNYDSEITNYFKNIANSMFKFYTAGSDFHKYESISSNNCNIGEPSLTAEELQFFLNSSNAISLGN